MTSGDAGRPIPRPLKPTSARATKDFAAMSESQTDTVPKFYACIPDIPDGPPIEIAWATIATGDHGVTCESRLIRPPTSWSPPFLRHPAALKAYGLKPSDLQQFGTPTREIAAHLNDTLAGRELFSATVDDDARIRRIFDAAKTAPKFELRKSDAEALIAELARLQRLPADAFARAKREAEVLCLTGLRAEAKPRYLATLWALVAPGE
jgi:hypothetical protein